MQVSIEIWYDNYCLCNSIHLGDLIHKDMIYYILKIILKYYKAIWGKGVMVPDKNTKYHKTCVIDSFY